MFKFLILLILFLDQQVEGLTVTDPGGLPVAGASVMCGDLLIGVSDAGGEVPIPPGTDTVTVRAIGYETWNGPLPASGTVLLEHVPVPSGVVVTVTGSRNTLHHRLPSTTSVGQTGMEKLGRTGLGDLGSHAAGILVRDYGGAMPVVSVSIRGSDPSHSGYLVDGHDVSSSMDGSAGLLIDPAVFGSMEIARGSGSRFLCGGMAGTLNFLPASNASPPRGAASLSDDGSGSLHGSLPVGLGRAALSLRRLTGIGGTSGYGATLLYTGTGSWTSFGLLTSYAEGGTESPVWSIATDGRRERASLDGWARFAVGESLTIRTDIRGGRHHYTSTEPEVIDDVHREAAAGLGAEFLAAYSGIELLVAADITLDRVWSTSIGERGLEEIQAVLETGLERNISLNASAAVNHVPGSGTLPAAGFMFGMPLGDSLLVAHAGLSTGFRRPTLNDLYWPEDSFASGNPDLEAERSVEAEAGITITPALWSRLSLTGFLSRSRNLIRWEPGEGGKWTPVNVARVLRKGIEAEGWFGTGPLELHGTLTLLEVEDDDPGSVNYGRTLPYVPDLTWALAASVELGRGVRIDLGSRGTGIRFTNYSETAWMDGFTLISGAITYSPLFLRGVSMELGVDNILEEEYLETSGFEGRSRTVHIGILWEGE